MEIINANIFYSKNKYTLNSIHLVLLKYYENYNIIC
jgi:hypothetical protein